MLLLKEEEEESNTDLKFDCSNLRLNSRLKGMQDNETVPDNPTYTIF